MKPAAQWRRDAFATASSALPSSLGETAIEGPLGDEVRDLCNGGVERDAAAASAASRCGK
jgi:hypothetical protein